MTDLATTLANLVKAMPAHSLSGDGGSRRDHLPLFDIAGANPGNLRARCFVPAGLPAGSALVVVLHGCTQTAADYDHGAGWSQLAQSEGFAVLFPEQQQINNQNLCFNWFSPIDQRRGSGEAQSIRTMIAEMVAAHSIDERRIFITGLSAGGAMASIMLATYPEVFAGGAIIAGLPFGAARSVADAFARMRGEGYPGSAELAAQLRDASDHRGPWPTLSVWHGSADTVVDPSNADRIVAQWQAVHGVKAQAPVSDRIDGHLRRRWNGADGRVAIESWTIAGMGHGTPLATRGTDAAGTSGPFMLEAGISSTRHIARDWQLLAEGKQSQVKSKPTLRPSGKAPSVRGSRQDAKGVAGVIEDALRAAGLMR